MNQRAIVRVCSLSFLPSSDLSTFQRYLYDKTSGHRYVFVTHQDYEFGMRTDPQDDKRSSKCSPSACHERIKRIINCISTPLCYRTMNIQTVTLTQRPYSVLYFKTWPTTWFFRNLMLRHCELNPFRILLITYATAIIHRVDVPGFIFGNFRHAFRLNY